MLGQRSYGAEALAALVALDLHAAVGMHALVPAQVRELGVRLEADLALERLDRRVDVRVLLEPGRGRERLPALGTGVTAGSHVVGADVPLKVRRIAEDLQREKKRNKNEPQLSKIDFSFTQIGNDVARANSDPGEISSERQLKETLLCDEINIITVIEAPKSWREIKSWRARSAIGNR